MLDTRNVEQTKDVRMYTWRIYSSRSGYIGAEYRTEDAWKNTGLYTLATKDWLLWELLLEVYWQVRIE